MREWQRLAGYFTGHRAHIGAALGANLARAVLVGASAYFLQRLIAGLGRSGLETNASYAAACLGCIAAASMAGLAARRTLLVVIKQTVARLRTDLHDKLHRIAITDVPALGRVHLQTVIVHDTESIDCYLNAMLGVILPAVASLVILTGVMAWISLPTATLIVIAAALPLLAGRAASALRSRDAADFRQAFERFANGTLLGIERAELARASAGIQQEAAQRRQDIAAVHEASFNMVWRSARLSELNQVAAALTLLLILCAMVLLNSNGSVDLPGVMTILMVLLLMRQQAGGMASQFPQLPAGRGALQRVFAFLDLPEEASWGGTQRIAFTGSLRVEDVTVELGGRRVLDRLYFALDAGSCVALSGVNGAGKTTLARLLLGLHPVKSGRLMADDTPYEKLDLDHLRRSIGWVPQDPYLFAGSVSSNIAYGLESSSVAEVIAAARVAGAHDFITALPHGYDTALDDHGFPLSGGERQWILLARALLRKPRLLVLDEPTSHLDRQATAALLQVLRGLKGSMTILLITHDREVAALADQHLVLAEGAIARAATHTHAREQLLA